jgi:hypothetical protein
MAVPNAAQLKVLTKLGIAMPDSSFYVRNADDLTNAISSVGRAAPSADQTEVARRNAVRLHLIKRANALNLAKMIPDTWNSDGSLKHSDLYDFLTHFGIKGMRWGVRKDGSAGSSHVSDDAAKAHALRATVGKHGTSALSNVELQHLVTRMNLEKAHGQLNPQHVSAGKAAVDKLLKIGGNVATQQATAYANKYAAEGLDQLIKKASA